MHFIFLVIYIIEALQCTYEQGKNINENIAPTHTFIYSTLCQGLNQEQKSIKDIKIKQLVTLD